MGGEAAMSGIPAIGMVEEGREDGLAALDAHLSGDEAAAKMGHPAYLTWMVVVRGRSREESPIRSWTGSASTSKRDCWSFQ